MNQKQTQTERQRQTEPKPYLLFVVFIHIVSMEEHWLHAHHVLKLHLSLWATQYSIGLATKQA